MSEVEAFLSPKDEAEIVLAIREAEKDTSGEIRVHLEFEDRGDPYRRAQEVFCLLKMDNTRQRNGVLIYVAVHAHHFVILGDSGIDHSVPPDFWNTTRDLMQEHFRNGAHKEGIIAGVLSAGRELKAHFPTGPDDQNELSDAITKT